MYLFFISSTLKHKLDHANNIYTVMLSFANFIDNFTLEFDEKTVLSDELNRPYNFDCW